MDFADKQYLAKQRSFAEALRFMRHCSLRFAGRLALNLNRTRQPDNLARGVRFENQDGILYVVPVPAQPGA